MSSMKDREEGFERKFAHDEELKFKATARRNKLLGLWVAEKLGKSGADADAYAKDVVAVRLRGSRRRGRVPQGRGRSSPRRASRLPNIKSAARCRS